VRHPSRKRGPAWLPWVQAVLPLLLWWPAADLVARIAPVGRGADGVVEPWSLLVHAAMFAPVMTGVVILVLRTSGLGLDDLGLRRPRPGWLRGLLFGAALGVGISFAIQPLEHLLGALGLTWNGAAFRVAGTGDWLAWSLAGVIAGGYTEELVFRGVALQRLEAALARWLRGRIAFGTAAVFVALEFGRRHFYQGSLGFVSTTVLGLALAAVYRMSGRDLAMTMAAHAAIDVTRFTQLWLAADPFPAAG